MSASGRFQFRSISSSSCLVQSPPLLGWSLYGKLDEVAFRKVVLVLLLCSGLAIVVTGR
jgi:hypothetical protein